MRKILSVFMSLALLMTVTTGVSFANDKNSEFKDIQGHWGKTSIMNMRSLGILQGYEDGTFRPNNPLSEDELAVMIDRLVQKRLNNVEDDEDLIIADDENGDLAKVPGWAKKAVNKGIHKNYLNLQRYHSAAQCDRLDVAVALAKALGLDPVKGADSSLFKDGMLIDDEEYGYLIALYEAGIIKGYPDGNFNPNAIINRAQMASIIDNIFDDDGDNGDNDTVAPTWPTNSAITATAITSDSISLKWTEASDNKSVAVYKVTYTLNSVNKEKFSYNRNITITGLDPDEAYTFTVNARDAAGNWSTSGPSVTAATLKSGDSTNPIWTSGSALAVTTSSATSVTLSWPDAQDNIAVTEYRVYQNSALAGVLDADKNELVITGLTVNTEYNFTIKARDAAGNWSVELTKTFLTHI